MEPAWSASIATANLALLDAPALANLRPGVQVGDRLLSVGGVPATGEELGFQFRMQYAEATEGVPIPIVLERGAERLTLQGKLTLLARELQLPAPLMSAARGPDATLWVGGDGEVFRVGPGAVNRIGPGANVPRGLVRDVLAEPDGTVWIGTYGGGVGRLRAGRVERLTVHQGLPDNSVSRILDDGRGRLWIATNRGIAVIGKSVRHSDLAILGDHPYGRKTSRRL